ncbi:metallophosphoesterase [Prosthecobacter sp. SYSU 5D2]|uniref:metallophosphoesterase n=1 Tax=Prosthecobacter sp. SYSU 5D2 TaxID=3134134 RepID=UPI0031FEB550
MPVTKPAITAEIAPGILLDSRRALINPMEGWMALADLHYGYEIHRSRAGALLPGWGMQKCRDTLLALIDDHAPQRLILAGDIMDGSGSVSETGILLEILRSRVEDLILIEGNHDRAGLKKGWRLQPFYREKDFVFHHGHQGAAPPSVAGCLPAESPHMTFVTGHEHPCVSLRDGAGLRLKLPALVQQRLRQDLHHWILPAFSPWAAGGTFRTSQEHLATWACTRTKVWKLS